MPPANEPPGTPAGGVPEPGPPAPAGASPAPTTGDRLGYDGDDADALTRRRRPAPRSRVPMFIAVGVFVAIAVAGIVVGIATRDDGDGNGGRTTSSTAGGQQANGFCPTGRWPAIAQGQPAALGEGGTPETGYYVWNDAFGWHVRMVDTAATPGRFTGEVVSSANLTSSEVIPEGAGEVQVNGNTLTWDFPGSQEPQGFDVAVGGCAADTVRFTLNDADGPVPESRVFVGTNSTAVSNPLIVRRQG
jgi:hypothetical protein